MVWAEVITTSRGPAVDTRLADKHTEEKFGVKARPPRLKPVCSKLDKADRQDKRRQLHQYETKRR